MFGSVQSLTFSRTLALQLAALIALLQCGGPCRSLNKDMTVGECVNSARVECVYERTCVYVCMCNCQNECRLEARDTSPSEKSCTVISATSLLQHAALFH